MTSLQWKEFHRSLRSWREKSAIFFISKQSQMTASALCRVTYRTGFQLVYLTFKKLENRERERFLYLYIHKKEDQIVLNNLRWCCQFLVSKNSHLPHFMFWMLAKTKQKPRRTSHSSQHCTGNRESKFRNNWLQIPMCL